MMTILNEINGTGDVDRIEGRDGDGPTGQARFENGDAVADNVIILEGVTTLTEAEFFFSGANIQPGCVITAHPQKV